MESISSLTDIKLTPLRKIDNPKGDIFHAIKASDLGFAGFGEAYFTSIRIGEVKGWKKHIAMTMNLIVPIGMVRFHVYDDVTATTEAFDIGLMNYQRLTIPPRYWVAFQGLTNEVSLILNVASLEHDPKESINASLDTYPLLQQ